MKKPSLPPNGDKKLGKILSHPSLVIA